MNIGLRRIINFTIPPGRVIFGMVDSEVAMDLTEGYTGHIPEDYLIKIREAQSILIEATQYYFKRHQAVDGKELWIGTEKLRSDQVYS